MCLVLYLGLDAESPLIPPQDFSAIDSDDPSWPSKVVSFSVESLSADTQVVANHFTTKVVRYAGSFEGCGCGYNACHVHEWEDQVDALSDRVLWDADWDTGDVFLDMEPEAGRALKELADIDEDYYTDIPPDPLEEELGSAYATLRELAGVEPE